MQANDPAAKPENPVTQSEEEFTTPLRGAALTVALLSLLYAVSYADRNILALLATPVSQALSLDDRQIALLLGLGFAVFYAIGGLVLGHFIDTRSRRIVVTAGVVLWSLATIMSGFATGFWSMLILRSGVALGEAVLTPAAISLIADLYPRHRRGPPVAIYTCIAGVMPIGSYAVGAVALDLATATSRGLGIEPWQLTFVFLGLPGLVLAAVFALAATVPDRRMDKSAMDEADMRMAFSYLRSRVAFFGPLLSLTGLNSLFALAIIAWLPSLLAREQGVSPSHAGYLLALVGVPAGLFGNFFWQWRATRAIASDPWSGMVRAFWFPALFTAPVFVAALMVSSLFLQLAFFFVAMVLSTSYAVLLPMSIQYYGPQRLRARMSSVYLLFIATFGYGLAPLAAVELGALVAGEGHGLRQGLVLLTLLVYPLIILLTFMANRHTDLAEVQ